MRTSPGLVRALAVAASVALSLSLIQVVASQDVALRSAASPDITSPSVASRSTASPKPASPASAPLNLGSPRAGISNPGTSGAGTSGTGAAGAAEAAKSNAGIPNTGGPVSGPANSGPANSASPGPQPSSSSSGTMPAGSPESPRSPRAVPQKAQVTPPSPVPPTPQPSAPRPSATPSPTPTAAKPKPSRPLRLSRTQRRLIDSVDVRRVHTHLKELQRIADANGGTRAAGTPGYRASRDYVAAKLREAGYRVTLQPFEFGYFAENSTALMERIAPTRATYAPTPPDGSATGDFATMTYSGTGEVTAPVHAVDVTLPPTAKHPSTSGCEHADFAKFPRGGIALIQRGTCSFALKVSNAQAAGAAAVIVFNEGLPDRTDLLRGSLSTPGVTIPVVGTTYATGAALATTRGAVIHLRTDTTSQARVTHNVIADSPRGDRNKVVMVGAHLDSVAAGPGINDNGSGSAAILAVAEALSDARTRNHLRFAWWGAEELGLIGSQHYVTTLPPDDRARIRLYLNFDMIASPNPAMKVYNGTVSSTGAVPPGSAEIEGLFRAHFDAVKQPYGEADLGGRSDYVGFMKAGIPTGGLFTGAGGVKTEEEARRFGGVAGRPYDPCYHRPCDTIANIDHPALAVATRAIATAVVVYASARDLPGPHA
ncbi:M28 family metallopeptidase [Thermopolyspora sp. NPDC052614]|uniref:M28 family metallopeptidase n=1 Tax=Thermopolyspora sp. NPDC052614 TaxID=3155682 RepID=UPI00343EA98A